VHIAVDPLQPLRGAPVSKVVRALIDHAYEEIQREERMQAASRIGQMQLEDVPDPEELCAQLDETHGSPDLP
jgi:hypothetical protein